MHGTVTTGRVTPAATQLELWFPEAVSDLGFVVELAVDIAEREHVMTLRSGDHPREFDVLRGSGWVDSHQLGASFTYLPEGRTGDLVELGRARLATPSTMVLVGVVPWLKTATTDPVARIWAHGRGAGKDALMAIHGVIR